MKDSEVDTRLRDARVARLATADGLGRPHVVPVCYAYDGKAFYTPLDRKPKKAGGELARVRNIRANPQVTLLVDHYDEDWGGLWYILVRGRGEILSSGEERKKAVELLREKYAQYASRELLPEDAAVIRITPEKVVSWGAV
jgi:PPOX class probable F420-dependent enzyme